MRQATHTTSHPRRARTLKLRPRHNSHLSRMQVVMLPIQGVRRNVTKFVAKKPYQSLGILTLVSGLVLSFVIKKFMD